MPKIDRIKETLGWLKVLFVALVAVDASLIAWPAQNFKTAETVLVVLASFAAVCTSTVIIVVNHVAYRRITELEDL